MISTSAVLLRRLTLFDDTLKNLRSGLDKGPIIKNLLNISKKFIKIDFNGQIKLHTKKELVVTNSLTELATPYPPSPFPDKYFRRVCA